MIVVAHNLAAMNANRQLNIVGDQKKKWLFGSLCG